MIDGNRLEEFVERYASGTIPWDDALPPPELMTLVEELKAGRALDLGCGYGRSSIYLALNGWDVDGVDFVPQAVQIAGERAVEAGVANRTRFHAAAVDNLGFLSGPYDLVLDIGCMHSLSETELVVYRDELLRLLRHGGIFLLFAHLRDTTGGNEDDIRWIDDDTLLALFSNGFTLERADYGSTQVGDNPPWRSAWFHYRHRKSL